MKSTSDPSYSAAESAFLQRSLDDLHERITVRAYFKAEKRGFAPGHALDDWLQAEAEILREEALTHGLTEE